MRTVKYYECDYCCQQFLTQKECEEHESAHIGTYYNYTNERLANVMEELSALSVDHNIHNMVFDMPVGSFQNLMDEVSSRLRGENNE